MQLHITYISFFIISIWWYIYTSFRIFRKDHSDFKYL